ncbi:MAG: hypothetical protein SAK29_12335 [Scytonema sp. PMC 1069.18]|nr:hypothetical protein [Scytonema sp. PMC 1069.18]MEC4886311.1 hypothetical protein [Scytonema sp. PMC 1070.18]
MIKPVGVKGDRYQESFEKNRILTAGIFKGDFEFSDIVQSLTIKGFVEIVQPFYFSKVKFC